MMDLIVLVGPTGVGKTDVAITLAKALGCEIINADSRQIYRGMSIGTAAPTKEQMSEVCHHFVATLDINDYYSAARFEADVLALINKKASDSSNACTGGDDKNGRIILSGGSMLYIDAVTKGIDDIPTVSDEVRTWMRQRLEDEGLERLSEELRLLDPDYYATADRKNTQRIIHALEVCHQSGRPYSYFRTQATKPRPFNIIKLGLKRERQELFSRINQRVDKMIEDGLLEEARNLLPHRGANALNTVGYKEMFKVLDGEWSLPFAAERLKKNTRVYAKKQMTWWMRDAEIHWFHPNETAQMLTFIGQNLAESPH
ncbi:MAG: tRNA (adenosine(37)-N6)-dimethylallyltransferase MiaA [Bacteroidaceae bacterium]|nr:tRNA (adenosine(37)-N6)-dimethylallyltransferase MiaA [Bacteroidaceae bacterium]